MCGDFTLNCLCLCLCPCLCLYGCLWVPCTEPVSVGKCQCLFIGPLLALCSMSSMFHVKHVFYQTHSAPPNPPPPLPLPHLSYAGCEIRGGACGIRVQVLFGVGAGVGVGVGVYVCCVGVGAVCVCVQIRNTKIRTCPKRPLDTDAVSKTEKFSKVGIQ